MFFFAIAGAALMYSVLQRYGREDCGVERLCLLVWFVRRGKESGRLGWWFFFWGVFVLRMPVIFLCGLFPLILVVGTDGS